jgi:hypothetical protein
LGEETSGFGKLTPLIVCIALIASALAAEDNSGFSSWAHEGFAPKRGQRVLIHRMTLEEKASQLMNQAGASVRLD